MKSLIAWFQQQSSRACAMFLLLACGALPAHAHKPSDSYLTLTTSDRLVEGQWDIALRDLEFAIGIDSNADGELSWGEIRDRHAAIAAYALSRLTLASAGAPCPLRAGAQLIDHHSDGAYTVLRFSARCAQPVQTLDVGYQLLFDVDPQHKGLLKLDSGGTVATAIFSPQHAQQGFDVTQSGRLRQFVDYLKHGTWHIWIGFDHILFLLSLLLPAVLTYQDKRWQSADSFGGALRDVLKIVTAFTIAHSITLSLAALQVVALPSRWVESAIAASVVVAALNNLLPVFQRQRWMAAFLFGLIHGFGFASVLADLGLPSSSLLLSLVAFNVGVEAGQLAIVAAFLPAAFLLRGTWLYRGLLFRAGSALIALVAVVWLFERALDVRLPLA